MLMPQLHNCLCMKHGWICLCLCQCLGSFVAWCIAGRMDVVSFSGRSRFRLYCCRSLTTAASDRIHQRSKARSHIPFHCRYNIVILDEQMSTWAYLRLQRGPLEGHLLLKSWQCCLQCRHTSLDGLLIKQQLVRPAESCPKTPCPFHMTGVHQCFCP